MKEKLNTAGVLKEVGSLNNKKGGWRTFKPVILAEKCTGCGICAKVCPDGVIEMKEVNGKKIAVVDYEYCPGCLVCYKECPFKAIEKMQEEK